ncbi:MAG TPA: putative metal-binding motif-containing protein [Kofleriaceae bacterium]|nr:putative metal-binding motif-containing protein [Kofleriaceae bacterium]
MVLGGCGSDPKEPLWPLDGQAVCEGAEVIPLAGTSPMVISELEIGDVEDGFDLDNDGDPDNKLAAVGSLARSAIRDAFESFDIVIPFEFFDFDGSGADECVKFAIYLGHYRMDNDNDGHETAEEGGDCNDNDPAINRDAVEIVGNFKDDNCDGLADETRVDDGNGGMTVVPSDDVEDRDEDGVTIADGDCDDTNPLVSPNLPEICGNGLDNNCDGIADFGLDENGVQMCSPYDAVPDLIGLDPLGFDAMGRPLIAFTSGTITEEGGKLRLRAGPSVFSVKIPVTGDLNLDLRISGARIEGDLVMGTAGWGIENGRLGGVLDANTLDKITGLEVSEIGLNPEDTLLDAIFANILGPILALPSLPDSSEWAGCRTPDIDVDQDGLEAFCDSDPLDEVSVVDVCIDGDGTVYRDENGVNCTEARDENGQLRFVDGISVEINFNAVPTILPTSLPPL